MTDIDKEREAFEAHFPQPSKIYITQQESQKAWHEWHNKLEGWQARAKQHSGEPVAMRIRFNADNTALAWIDYDAEYAEKAKVHKDISVECAYLSPQQPESVAEALEKEKQRADAWVKEVRDLARDNGLADEDSNGSIHDWRFIRNLINQPTTKNNIDANLPKYHRWNDDGERCLDCGDKDWMQSPNCSGSKLKDK